MRNPRVQLPRLDAFRSEVEGVLGGHQVEPSLILVHVVHVM